MDPEELKRAVLAMKNDDTALGVKAMVHFRDFIQQQ